MKHLRTLLGKGFNLRAHGLLVSALAVTALGLAAPASAVPVINTTVDQSFGDCSITCSLRDAVALANSGDTLRVPAGHYVLTLGEIVSPKSLTLVGDGARSTVLDGNGASRIFLFETWIGQATVELTDMSLINGLATTPYFGILGGGALRGNAFLTLRRCLLAGNKAQAGGAIFWYNHLTIDQCTIADNVATSQAYNGLAGGGIFASAMLLKITNSTLSGNTALAGAGGAIATLREYLNLYNVTVTANQALAGAGVYLEYSHLIMFNTIIADNPGGNCSGNQRSVVPEYSLDSDKTCSLGGPGDLPGVAPLLGPLANNGGPTDTHALLAGSPALDAGGSTSCQATDQRGVTRPQGPGCDIGAFEGFVPSTPQDQVAALIAEIDALVTGGTLAPNKANPLLTKLNQALDKLDAGQTSQACGQLGAFINQVNAYIRNGNLTSAQGEALIDATNALRADIGC